MVNVSGTVITVDGLDTVEGAHPGDFAKLPAGGYVCMITKVMIDKTSTGKFKLVLTFDVAEGEYRGIFKNSQYPPVLHQLIEDEKGGATKFFKGMLEDVQASNPEWKLPAGKSVDIRPLLNKKVGVLFVEEEYLNKNGEVKTAVRPRNTLTVKQIREKNFTVPPIKKLPEELKNNNKEQGAVDDDEFIGEEISDKQVPF